MSISVIPRGQHADVVGGGGRGELEQAAALGGDVAACCSSARSTPVRCRPKFPASPRSLSGWNRAREEEEILGGQQVNGVAEQVGAHHGPFGQKVLKMLVTEAGQPRPQPDVRRERSLGLQRGQVLDRLPGGPGVPAQQQLAVQGGAVQGAGAELVGGHGRSAAAVGSSAG